MARNWGAGQESVRGPPVGRGQVDPPLPLSRGLDVTPKNCAGEGGPRGHWGRWYKVQPGPGGGVRALSVVLGCVWGDRPQGLGARRGMWTPRAAGCRGLGLGG